MRTAHYNTKKTQCPQGHPYSGGNLYIFPNGRHRACRRCRAEATRRTRRRYPEKARRQSRDAAARRYALHGVRMRRNQRLRKYGLTAEELEEMRVQQNGHCGACDTSLDSSEHIDHCHQTGKVRGLLCSRCNLALGQVKEDPVVLRGLLQYLEEVNVAPE